MSDTRTTTHATSITALHDLYNGRKVEPELLENGELVYVATCLYRDGCLAQGATHDAAVHALEIARLDYDAT